MNATTANQRPAAMKASDADRDAVVCDLSEHFQAGRITAAEFDERTGRALTARTFGELGVLVADLPATTAPADTFESVRQGPPAIAVLAGIGITALVLMGLTHSGWGLLWVVFGLFFIAKRFRPYAR